MKISKLIFRYWWFVLVLVIAGYFLVVNTAKSRLEDAETNFAINAETTVTRIVISDGELSVTLEASSSDGWVLNGKYQVSDNAIKTFFLMATRLQNAGPVSLSLNDSLIDAVQLYGKHIEIFSRNKRVLNYWILDTDMLNLKTVGYTGKGESVYKLELPNYTGSIANLIKVDDASWSGNLVPAPSIYQIEAVEVDVPHDPEAAFRIDVVSDKNYRVLNLYNGFEIENLDNDRVFDFLTVLSQIHHQGIAELTSKQKTQMTSSNPDFVFNIFTSEGSNHVLKVFPIPVKVYTDELGRKINVDLNRVYIEVPTENRIYIVNYIDLYSLLRDVSSLTL